MLELDSPRWKELEHAYGPASDIPELLRSLKCEAKPGPESEPWFSLWSALAHQGDVYSASFAAVPHVVRVLAMAPANASFDFFQFPAWIEICRYKKSVFVPEDLLPAYKEALEQLPRLVAEAATREWDDGFLSCALSALAAAKGSPVVAEAAQELTPEVAKDFLNWWSDR